MIESDWWLLYLGVQKGLPEKVTLMLRLNYKRKAATCGLGVSIPRTGQSRLKGPKIALQLVCKAVVTM